MTFLVTHLEIVSRYVWWNLSFARQSKEVEMMSICKIVVLHLITNQRIEMWSEVFRFDVLGGTKM